MGGGLAFFGAGHAADDGRGVDAYKSSAISGQQKLSRSPI